MILSGQQRKKLQEALIHAFPNKSSLKQMLRFELDKNLEVIAGEGNLQNIVFTLIETADSQGWVEKLISGALQSNPGNPLLKTIAEIIIKSQGKKVEPNPDPIPVLELLDNKNEDNKNEDNKNEDNKNEDDKNEDDKNEDDKNEGKEEQCLKPGIKVEQLQNYMSAGEWKEADQETTRILLEIANRQEEGWLRSIDIEQLHCSELHAIDQLWVKYSNRKFGFSVQRKIWLSIGGKPGKFSSTAFRKFGDRVGWRVNNDWLEQYEKFSFTSDAPQGHLPSLRLMGVEKEANWWGLWQKSFEGFLSRLENCL